MSRNIVWYHDWQALVDGYHKYLNRTTTVADNHTEMVRNPIRSGVLAFWYHPAEPCCMAAASGRRVLPP
jgi:hypothetical protein